jgi:hypothetical protein
MQLLFSKSSEFERHLSRSFLLEHGVHATNIIKQLNQNGNNNNKK